MYCPTKELLMSCYCKKHKCRVVGSLLKGVREDKAVDWLAAGATDDRMTGEQHKTLWKQTAFG
eukprot:10859710-Karenia_brevis.AAC.1